MIYSDGSNYYFLLTNVNDPLGGFNGLRPFYITLSTGNVTMSHNVSIGVNTTIGGTLNVGPSTPNQAGDIGAARTGSPGTGVLYLGTSGARYLYYDGTNYTLNGAHAYSLAGRLLGTTTDVGLLINSRLAFLADTSYINDTSLHEPYGGGVLTGISGPTSNAIAVRYRQLQVQHLDGNWFACGYA